MATLVETNETPLDRVDVDPVTVDIIENALRNARYEMDAVLFRTAMSPGIREQHDEFPLIADPTGKMVVGQFGLSIPDFLAGFDGTIEEGDILLTSDPYQPGGLDGGLFRRKIPSLSVFDEGSALAEPHPSVAPLPGEVVVRKQYASGFFGTSLASTLRALGADTVVIVGLTTSGCVRATAVDALQHGFVPVVVRDAVGDRDPRPHEANLLDLEAKYADVVSEREALAALAATPPDVP